MTNITILEFPSNLGLIEPMPGHEPGVKKLPGWLQKYNFHNLLKPEKIYSLSPPPYSMNIDKDSGVRNANAISEYAKQQADALKKVILEKTFPVVVGGDCSILIGNLLALKLIGRFGLFFLDGHTDFAWPNLSNSHGAAGMELAIVTGHGHHKLSNILNLGPYVNEENVWCVGNREFDELYVSTIANSKINYFDLNKLRETGIENCCNSFLRMVSENNLDGFWLHLDVDVLNDDIMPAVDSREKGGLFYDELKQILKILLHHNKASGIQITILDPDLDLTGVYTKQFVNEIGVLIALRNEDAT